MKVLVTMGFEVNEEDYSKLKQSILREEIDDCMYDISMKNGWESEFFEIALDKNPRV